MLPAANAVAYFHLGSKALIGEKPHFDVLLHKVRYFLLWPTHVHMKSPQSKVVSSLTEQCHMAFLRGWCHLRGSEPKSSLYCELGRLPFHYSWWRDIVRFANRVPILPDGSLWRQMMHDRLVSAEQGKLGLGFRV